MSRSLVAGFRYFRSTLAAASRSDNILTFTFSVSVLTFKLTNANHYTSTLTKRNNKSNDPIHDENMSRWHTEISIRLTSTLQFPGSLNIAVQIGRAHV